MLFGISYADLMLCSMNSAPPIAFLSLIILLSCFPGHVNPAVVNLHSIVLYNTHEWLLKPTVYFQCRGENETILPDVKQIEVVYTFKGEESWQPLTNFSSTKCKRCGLYEKDFLRVDVFDEWELCPSEFAAPDGRYTHVKLKEFNATFSCTECLNLGADHSITPPPSHSGKKRIHIAVVIVICAAIVAAILGSVLGYKHWRKRKRQQEQARFLKLFEEHDDDELGLDEML